MQDCALNFRFQELDLSREAFIFSESSKEAEWQEAVRQYLHPKGRYRKVSVSCRWTRLLTPPCKGSSIGWNKRGGSSWGVHWPQSGHAGRVFGWVETKGGVFGEGFTDHNQAVQGGFFGALQMESRYHQHCHHLCGNKKSGFRKSHLKRGLVWHKGSLSSRVPLYCSMTQRCSTYTNMLG